MKEILYFLIISVIISCRKQQQAKQIRQTTIETDFYTFSLIFIISYVVELDFYTDSMYLILSII